MEPDDKLPASDLESRESEPCMEECRNFDSWPKLPN